MASLQWRQEPGSKNWVLGSVAKVLWASLSSGEEWHWRIRPDEDGNCWCRCPNGYGYQTRQEAMEAAVMALTHWALTGRTKRCAAICCHGWQELLKHR